MASRTELARRTAGLSEAQIQHVQRLLRTWSLIADLGLADLLLLAPVVEAAEPQLVVLGNVRPSTAATMYSHDPVGDRHKPDNRQLAWDACQTGTVQRGRVALGPTFPEGEAEIVAAPLLFEGRPMGVLLRERRTGGRELYRLEQTYLSLAERLTDMVAEGTFPFVGAEEPQYGAPRVGDGLVVLDDDRRIVFQSPNAISALHRLGVHRPIIGRRLAEVGFDDSFVRSAHGMQVGVSQEVEQGDDVTVTSRCIPLLADGKTEGSFILFRDVSELKRRDRLLLTKDATIREIHHRVKNNLQTISSLLRLQARRVESDEGRHALMESVRRIAAIAIVHETLANDGSDDASGDDAPFVDVARPLIRLIEEGLASADDPIQFTVDGEAGRLPLVRSMPLAVVLTELLQNVVDHAFPRDLSLDGEPKSVIVRFEEDDADSMLVVEVSDNGVGPGVGFDFAEASGLGLTLVHTFVTTELRGTIEMQPGGGPEHRPGTVTTMRFPRSWDDRVAGPALDG